LKDERTFVLAPRLFPRALLDFRKKHAIKLITAQITPFQMDLIVKDDISGRLKEGCNKVGATILSPIWRHLLSKMPDKYTKVANFVQAPVVTKEEALDFVRFYSSSCTARANKRDMFPTKRDASF
jgi:hypothetical protein